MNDFASVLGHEGVKHHLMTALSDGLISHAYLIEGPRGVGKKTLSRALVRALLCEEPVHLPDGGIDSCGHCRCCELLDHSNHPDVKIIRPAEEGKAITVDQIRDELVSDMQVLPYMDSYKIYVVENADKLNAQAQNALLKTIEEPPSYGLILLLAENETSFLPTILSRCIRVSLSPLPSDLVMQSLRQKNIPEDTAALCAAFSQGSIGEALQLCSDETFASLRSTLFDFLASIPQCTPLQILNGGKIFDEYKSRRDAVFSLLNLWFRDVGVYRETKDSSMLLLKDRLDDIARLSEYYSSEKILRICDRISDTYKKLQANVNAQLAIDCLMIELQNS